MTADEILAEARKALAHHEAEAAKLRKLLGAGEPVRLSPLPEVAPIVWPVLPICSCGSIGSIGSTGVGDPMLCPVHGYRRTITVTTPNALPWPGYPEPYIGDLPGQMGEVVCGGTIGVSKDLVFRC